MMAEKESGRESKVKRNRILLKLSPPFISATIAIASIVGDGTDRSPDNLIDQTASAGIQSVPELLQYDNSISGNLIFENPIDQAVDKKQETRHSYYLPLSINIPTLSLEENISQSNFDKDKQTFIVSDNGLSSTASEDPQNNKASKNSIYVFGHSSFAGKNQPFYNLYKMALNDRIFVKTKIMGTNEQKILEFHVKDIIVTDLSDTELLGDQDEPTLILQTSLRPTYNPAMGWAGRPIMPMDETLSKATSIQTDVGNKDNYLVLVIVGKLAG